jgi:hypothetical protein
MMEEPNISQHGVITTIYFNVLSGWEKWFLLMSDNHFDSVFCNRELMTSHFEEAKNRNARIMIFGDWFDAMQGRFDPRRSMDELRSEYRREDYYDFVVQDSRDYLSPYAKLIDVMSDGNHELAVLKNANTNLMDRLVFALNDKIGSKIVHGGYGGWIRLMFILAVVGGGTRISKKIKYFHGSGGDAPVTRGVIQTNRQAVYLPDANIVVNGHSHNEYHIAIARERLNSKGNLYFDLQHHIRIPGYKQSYGDGSTGWDVTRGSPPKPLGAIWVRFSCEKDDINIQVTPNITGGDAISLNSNDLYTGHIFNDDREGE